jgi:hypothetical protein
MSNFRQVDRETGFLLPPSMDEWPPQRHLARFEVEVIDGLSVIRLTFLNGFFCDAGERERMSCPCRKTLQQERFNL